MARWGFAIRSSNDDAASITENGAFKFAIRVNGLLFIRDGEYAFRRNKMGFDGAAFVR